MQNILKPARNFQTIKKFPTTLLLFCTLHYCTMLFILSHREKTPKSLKKKTHSRISFLQNFNVFCFCHLKTNLIMLFFFYVGLSRWIPFSFFQVVMHQPDKSICLKESTGQAKTILCIHKVKRFFSIAAKKKMLKFQFLKFQKKV